MKERITQTGPFLDLLSQIRLEELEDELAKVKSQIAQLDTARQLLDLAISTRRAANGDRQDATIAASPANATAIAPTPTIGVKPKLKQAILAVMADAVPGQGWSPVEIHSELENRGWAPQTESARSQISNRLRDLVKSGQLRKPEPGRYYLMRGD